MESRTEVLPITLASGHIVQVEAAVKSQEEDVAFGMPSIEGLREAIEGLSTTIMDALKTIQPKKATVEFGIQAAVEAGKLTALLVSGTGTASIKVTLEWGS